MSWPKAFSVASTTAAVPGVKVVTQRVISRSPRSAMWSLCRWVSSRAADIATTSPGRHGLDLDLRLIFAGCFHDDQSRRSLV